jgi:hypothetical protein
VIIPRARHVTFENSPVTPSSDGQPCGRHIIGAFLQNPTTALETQCTADIPPTDFHGNASLAASLFGTSDLYE